MILPDQNPLRDSTDRGGQGVLPCGDHRPCRLRVWLSSRTGEYDL